MSTTKRPPSKGLTQEQRRYACKAIDNRFSVAIRTVSTAELPANLQELRVPDVHSNSYRRGRHFDFQVDSEIEDAPKPIMSLQAKLEKKVRELNQTLLDLETAIVEHNAQSVVERNAWAKNKRSLQLQLENARDEAKLRTQLNGAGDELLEFLSEAVPNIDQLQDQARKLGITLNEDVALLEAQ